MEARSQEMTYEEAKREARYKGDVSLVQADVKTKSQQALLVLAEDGGSLQRLEATEAVELRQATRIATGQKAVYTPPDKSIVVTGDKVELVDETQKVSGPSLKFFVGDDRILVDGREVARTETILRKRP
jgi:lipopolysaccharide export system protein LptA